MDPSTVAKAMFSTRDVSGKKLFSAGEYLTATQISGFFSRLASKKTLQSKDQESADETGESDDKSSLIEESAMQEITDLVVREMALGYPLIYDVYNICDMVSNSKMKNFLVSMLDLICQHFGIDTSDVKDSRQRLKKLFTEKLKVPWQSCSCQKQ